MIKNEQAPTAKLYVSAIEAAIEETRLLPDGESRVQAVKLVYFDKTNTLEGAAQKLFASQHTVMRWTSSFVYLVASKVGF